MADDHLERLRELVGVEGPVSAAHYPVSEAMIHHWCDAIGDLNPVYVDAEAARAVGHEGVVAPPTMLQAWTMPGLKPWREAEELNPAGETVKILEDAGFVGVVATNCDQEYARYVRPGDRITSTQALESVSELKKTGLGEGHFVTQLWTFRDGDGATVGTMRFRMLFFRPDLAALAPPAEEQKAPRPRPAATRDTEFFWKGAAAGKLLIQQCSQCGELRHPPGPMCPHCQSLQWQPVESSGRGTVYSYVRHYHPQIPPFEPGHPIVLVELEEGVRIVADLAGGAGEDVAIGQPVHVELNEVDEGLTLPQFRVVRRLPSRG